MSEKPESKIEGRGQGDVSLPESTDALARWEHDFVTTVLNTAPCLIVVLDRDGRILRFNRACHELTGYTLEEVCGHTVWDFLLPTEHIGPVKGVFEGLVREAPEAGDLRLYPHTYENDWIAKDGTRRSILWSNDCLRGPQGQIVAVVGSGLDITERKQAEDALRESQARYRSLIDHASVCIKELDRDGRIVNMNNAGLRILGATQEHDVIGRDFVDCAASADQSRIRELLTRAYDGHSSEEFEFTAFCLGKPATLLSTLIPVAGPDGHVQRVVGVTQDITERKRAQEKLIEQASLVRLGEMTAVIAHEVKNPLAGIRGTLQVVGPRLPEGSRARREVLDLVRRVDALNEMVDDLLTYARPVHPRVEDTPVSIRALLEETSLLLRQDPGLSGVNVQYSGDAPLVRADGQQLSQVFLNLLLNGAQAMGGKGTVHVASKVDDGICEVTFRDEGPGIPAEVRNQAFEPFYTTKHRGTGLGLPTARRIVEAHGGSLEIEPSIKDGAIVRVSLPTAAPSRH